MKNIVIVCLSFFFISTLYGQQEPLVSQYTMNGNLYNPAIVGSSKYHEIRSLNHFQWVGFGFGPETNTLSYNGGFNRLGLGGAFVYDVTGPTSRIGGKLAISYHIPFSEKVKLSIGAEGRYTKYDVRVETIKFVEPNDNAILNGDEDVSTGEAGIGAYFYSEKLRIGFSATNLLQSKLDFGTNADSRLPVAQYYRHYFLNAGYRFDFDKFSFEPTALVKMTASTPIQYQALLQLHFLENDQLTIGAGYRSPGFVSLVLKTVFDKQFPIVISFDVATSKFQNYSLYSYEFSLGADFLRSEFREDEMVDP